MTTALQLQQPQELVMAVGAPVHDLEELLRHLSRLYYDKVIIYGGEADPVSDAVKEVVKKADRHGIPIEDATPPGSEFARLLTQITSA